MSAPVRQVDAVAGARIVTGAERPELAADVPDLLSSRWPMFMLAGQPGHDVDLTSLVMQHPDHQVLLIDDGDRLLGAGLSLPLAWDGTVSGLPAGWDAAVTAGAALHERGGTPNAVCALSITTVPAGKGTDYPARIMAGLKEAAAKAGAAEVIVPVRPVLKARYPLIPMGRYLTWQTDDGRAFDPWLRLHLGLGGRMLGIAPESMRITGSVAEWGQWLDLPLPDSGEYVIPGGLAPLVIDRDTDKGVYREPNVWVVHRTGS